jgi:hypothetical protein
MIQTFYQNKESEYEDNTKNEMIHDIIDDIYDDMNHKNIETIFEESYQSFIDFLKYNVFIEKTYDLDENINKYSKLYINLLYDVIYNKASYEEELLNDFINDEDGDFFEFYKNYTPSKNINVISDLNSIHCELNDIQFTVQNLHILKDYVLKFANFYIILTSDNE